eukprot:2035189-Pleurochrysis_carterae.AAC.1
MQLGVMTWMRELLVVESDAPVVSTRLSLEAEADETESIRCPAPGTSPSGPGASAIGASR